MLINFFLLRNVILRLHEFRYKLSVYVTSLCYCTGFLLIFVCCIVSLKCIKNSFKIRKIFIKPVFLQTKSVLCTNLNYNAPLRYQFQFGRGGIIHIVKIVIFSKHANNLIIFNTYYTAGKHEYKGYLRHNIINFK